MIDNPSYALGLLWIMFGIIEYFWYLGMYRLYPDQHVSKEFQEELRDKPVTIRAKLFVVSLVIGPFSVIKSAMNGSRQFAFALY
jgi:hypothetical protein